MPFIPKLQQTKNFFELYQYICGKSEVPTIYHFWASVALLAATMEDRVWVEKFRGEKLYANLYIMLIGEGGLGKGEAISQANRLIDSSAQIPKFRGSLTQASLIDQLGKVEKDEWGRQTIPNPRLWLIMDELKNNLGTNVALVEAFIALMTELYTATNYTINTSTRKHGKVDIANAVVNWLAGTTEGDLRDILTRKLIDSGFTARVCFVFGEYDFSKRYPKITYPQDYEEVYEHLRLRLWMLRATPPTQVEMTPEAEAEQENWYMSRPPPEEKMFYSMWRRQHDMLLKFALLCCVADGGAMVIKATHIRRAKAMINSTAVFTGKLFDMAHETWDTKPSNEVAEFIKERKILDRSSVTKYFRTKRGMAAKKVQEAVAQLVQENLVKYSRTPSGAIIYEWIG